MLAGEGDAALRGTLVQLKSAALQSGHAGLEVKVIFGGDGGTLVRDWSLLEDGITVDTTNTETVADFSVRLVSPEGQIIHDWKTYPGPVDLGLALRQNVGRPEFSHLHFENVRATD
jgi:hypothetical protein